MDKSGECWVWNAPSKTGYGTFYVGAEFGSTAAHRFSYEIANGPIPGGLWIDHICHNPSCVRPIHLRAVTPKQNCEHRVGTTAKSGVRGVHWRPDIDKWQVTVRATQGGVCKTRHGGYFTDLADAERAARAKRNELFTHNEEDRRLVNILGYFVHEH